MSIASPIDGRHRRGIATRAAIIASCRRLMMEEGDFRPSVERVAGGVDVSSRSVFQHFGTMQGLYRAALGLDDAIRDSIMVLVLGTRAFGLSPFVRDRLVNALVLGELGVPEAEAAVAAKPIEAAASELAA